MGVITTDYTTTGITTWTVPSGASSAVMTAIGAGCSGESSGSNGRGGGGGGFARSSFVLYAGELYEIQVGLGSLDWNTKGGDSYVKKLSGPVGSNPITTFVLAAGGGPITAASSGSLTAAFGTSSTTVEGSVGDTTILSRGGRAGNTTTMIPSYRASGGSGGFGTNLTGSENTTDNGSNGVLYGGGGGGNIGLNANNQGFGANGAVRIAVTYNLPTITSFTASPNTQTSSSGTPTYTTSLAWSTTNAVGGTATITSNAGESWTVNSTGGGLNITNLPQSTQSSNSPATRAYTLTVYNAINESTTSTITVSAYNDNVCNDFIVDSQLNKEPNVTYQWTVGPINGIDMPTYVQASVGCDISLNGTSWSNNLYINNDQLFYVRSTTLGFNTSPNGLVNTKNLYIDIGPVRRYFDVQTRAPNVNEIFDYGDSTQLFPYPDIDQVSNTPTPYMTSPTTLTVDNVELANPEGTEMISDNAETQVRIKPVGTSSFGSWVYLRQGFVKIPFGTITARTGSVTNTTPTQFNTRNSGTVTSINTTA